MANQSGFTYEWLDGIHIYTLKDPSRDTIDMWTNTIRGVFATWSPDSIYLSVQDISAITLTLTPYLRKQAQTLAEISQHVTGYSAVVVPNSGIATIAKYFVVREVRTVQTGIERQFFADRDKALAWLRTKTN